MTETPTQDQNHAPSPLDPAIVATLSSELRDPNTSFERVEEILAIAQGVQIGPEQQIAQTATFETDSKQWQALSDAQLAGLLIDPHTKPEVKDAISQFVNSRNTSKPSADQ